MAFWFAVLGAFISAVGLGLPLSAWLHLSPLWGAALGAAVYAIVLVFLGLRLDELDNS